MCNTFLSRHIWAGLITPAARQIVGMVSIFFAPIPALALSGTVMDEFGNGIAGAQIELIGYGVEIQTDQVGYFEFEIEDVDELHIKAAGYSHKVLHLHGKDSENLNIVLFSSVIEQVDVIGLPLHNSVMESSKPIAVIGAEELRNKQASTLGETLKNEVGVHSTYFGPVASSPIIRGLDGPRVLVTQNGLDVGDASRVGPDHVVSTEAATAQQIEILRGPATLFYGSGAIGGVVNVVDDRVPANSESQAAFTARHNTVANENEVSVAYTGGSDRLAIHVDGFWRDGSDYDIPGVAELETAEQHEQEAHAEHVKGVLQNSASESEGYNVGGSLLLDTGFVGFSYGRLEKLNGVPGHGHNGEHEQDEEAGEEEERVLSDLEQDRWQLIGELQVDGDYLASINTRAGYTEYTHAEIENGQIGTVFKNQTLQAQADFLHQEFRGWRGAASLDYKNTDFEAVGEEAFTSPSETQTFAITLLEEKHVEEFLWQLGARLEQVNLDADPIEIEAHHEELEGEELKILNFDELDFTPYSFSAGFVWDFISGYNLGLALTHAKRAPTAAELYSLGPHIATRAYEVGSLFELHEESGEVHVDFHGRADEEVSNNLDLSVRKHEGDFGFVLNIYYNKINNFYYPRNSGYQVADIFAHEDEMSATEHEHDDDLPVYVFEQADAKFYGFEAELALQVTGATKWSWWADGIRGKLEDGSNLPRIPPARIGSQLNLVYRQWDFELSVAHYFDQNKTAINETNTDGYTMVDAQLAYYIESTAGEIALFAKLGNFADEEARVHSSFLKNSAPLPGRGFSVGVRGYF